MICPTFSSFRWTFATRVQSTVTATFAGGNLTRAAGSFTADGVVAGMSVNIAGAVNAANNTRALVSSVIALGATLVTDASFTGEVGTAGVVIDAVAYDRDGLETWPVAKLRSGGFDTGITRVYPSGAAYEIGTALELTCNAGAADAVSGVDEFDWYVSQQSDIVANQLFLPYQKPASGASTYSGTIRMLTGLGGLAGTEFPSVTVCTPEVTALLFRHIHVYCRRRSDGAIQWLDMLEEMLP